MMLFIFISFISSTLHRGDDPYAILGVSRDATMQEIRSAFRKIAFDHHPDRHKGDEESYKIWLRANDAYDLLTDPQSKLRYDQYGTVSDDDYNQQNQNQNSHYYSNHYYQNYQTSRNYQTSENYENTKPKYTAPLVTQQLFPYLARDGSEWIIFVSQNFDCPKCPKQQEIWDELANEIKDYVKVGRLDATQAPDLIEKLGVTTLPQFLSVKMINTEKQEYKVKKIGNHFKSKENAVSAVFKHWKSSIKTINDYHSFENWLNKNSNKVHVIEISNEKKISIHFRYSASKLRKNAIFGSVQTSSISNFQKE
ncbi:hypothetical protein TRFO_31983 [Tritrichomonas foetus]|uniref:J domain-containing protein n=1 Tax=Tritrichomonas foetus TaxID=1144522 RepID=A0A1J4JS34_9EUKA|nr:hypothetical protein TRFO_31983 [Tritrichomonas foetus]|eukprot:OHT01240.1 hypothetical protein TRFO_31983 [Tritrichomonas foetus]